MGGGSGEASEQHKRANGNRRTWGGSGEASEQHKRTNGNRRTWGVPGRPRSSTSARTATVVRGGFRGGSAPRESTAGHGEAASRRAWLVATGTIARAERSSKCPRFTVPADFKPVPSPRRRRRMRGAAKRCVRRDARTRKEVP